MTRALFVLVVLVASCTGTETGNPSLTGQMAVVGRSSMPLRVGLPGDTAPILVDRLEVNVEAIDLIAASECEGGAAGPVELAGLGVIDLLDPAGTYAMTVSEDAYCAVRIETAFLGVAGTNRDGPPFFLMMTAPRTIELPAADALFLFDAEHTDFLTTVDAAVLLETADLGAAVAGPDGSANLAAPENAAIGMAVAAAFDTAAALHRDHDGDGELDAEDVPILHAMH